MHGPGWRTCAVEGALLALLTAVFLHAVFFRNGTFVYLFHKASTAAWIDEGARVAAGDVPYRDFTDRVGPGILYLNAALVRAAGDGLATFAGAGLAMGGLLALALYVLAGAVVRGPWRLLPPAVFVVLVYPPYDLGHHKWPALLLAWSAAGLALYARARMRWLLAAGASAGLAIAFTPTLGFAALAGLLVHTAREGGARRRAESGALLAGALGTTALVALWLAAGAGMVALEAWLGPVREARPILLLPGRWSGMNAAWLVMAAGSVAAAVWRLRVTDDPRERLLSRFGLVLLIATAAGYVDGYALAVHAAPLAVLAAAAAERLGTALRRALAVVTVAGLAAAALVQIVWRQRVQPLTRQEFRAGAAWIGAPNRELPWLESRTWPGDRVFVFPAGGGSYFLTRTRNATALPYVIEGQATVADQQRLLAEIEAARPAVGVWMGGQRVAPPAGAASLDTLYEGILKSYQAEAALPDGTLLLRRRD